MTRTAAPVTPRTLALLRAAHGGPSLAVTSITALLAVGADLGPARIVLVSATVLSGQLSVGWSNDLIDRDRDRQVGRDDKPLVTGRLTERAVVVACACALVSTFALSLACGPTAGLTHLALCVGGGWAYNVGVKGTVWSWVPYAAAFGALPVVVSLTRTTAELPPWWMPITGALLGVGAHLVNALPDLADDETTGVRGLPHRLGPRVSTYVAVTVLVAASLLIVTNAPALSALGALAVIAVVGALAVVAVTGHGRTPFRAAMLIALVDVVAFVGAR